MQNEPSKEARGIVPVSQRAREAAEIVLRRIERGLFPAHLDRVAEAFARFEAETLERAAKVADDAAEGSRVLHNLAAKDRDLDGCNVHGEGWRIGQQIAAAIRNQEPQP